MSNKKLCTLFDDGSPNLLLLSDDQIAMIAWLRNRGYELRVELIGGIPEEVKYEDWKNKVTGYNSK